MKGAAIGVIVGLGGAWLWSITMEVFAEGDPVPLGVPDSLAVPVFVLGPTIICGIIGFVVGRWATRRG